MVLMKDITWAFANAVSQVCVEDDGVSCTVSRIGVPELTRAVVRTNPGEARNLRTRQRHGRVRSRVGYG